MREAISFHMEGEEDEIPAPQTDVEMLEIAQVNPRPAGRISAGFILRMAWHVGSTGRRDHRDLGFGIVRG